MGDRVNSSRGPGEDRAHPMKRGRQATEEEKMFAVDDEGYLVFPATVRKVEGAELYLEYDGKSEGLFGWESMDHVRPRVCMPWHPKFLKGDFSIMLRRNVGQGVVMEGPEVRWWVVSALLKVLMRYHKWYREDRRLFDVALQEDDLFGDVGLLLGKEGNLWKKY